MTEKTNVQTIAPCEHIVQFYEHDRVLIETLIGFIGAALNTGESAIVITTESHLSTLEQGLYEAGVDIVSAMIQGRYIALLAHKGLERFMVKQWPDEKLFFNFMAELITRTRVKGRRVRAFGEMVALLMATGNIEGTVRLEHLWQQLCEAEGLSLLCAYPKVMSMTENSLREICAAHSKVI